MKQHRIHVRKCPESGVLGFQIEGTDFVATDGRTVAHTLIEHTNRLECLGMLHDDFMALGAMWECRGQFGDIERGNHVSVLTPEQYIAGELPALFLRYQQDKSIQGNVPEGYSGLPDQLILWHDRIAEEGIKMSRGEWMDMDTWDFDLWDEFINVGAVLFCYGAYRFDKKYDGNPMLGNSQFWMIDQEVNRAIHGYDLREGECWALGYGDSSCDISRTEWSQKGEALRA